MSRRTKPSAYKSWQGVQEQCGAAFKHIYLVVGNLVCLTNTLNADVRSSENKIIDALQR